jgi:hypothetical protein
VFTAGFRCAFSWRKAKHRERRKEMKFKTIAAVLAVMGLTAVMAAPKDTPDEQRAKIRKMAADSMA